LSSVIRGDFQEDDDDQLSRIHTGGHPGGTNILE
jgi:hypothetical protein